MMESHTAQIEVRFSDIDVMGHVNNAVYLSYFEQARMGYFAELLEGEWDWNQHGILLARNEVDYLSPILLHDSVFITTTVQAIGNKSLTISYKVHVKRKGETKLCAKGSSVLVCFDYHAQKSIPVPEEWRLRMKIMGDSSE